MPAQKVESLRPKLEQAQRALDEALDEACETDVEGVDVPELIRLEESLTVARDAAKTVITVLQRLNHVPFEERGVADTQTHRVFVDEHGVQWDAFPVFPSRATKGRTALPAPYDKGWLAIQCPDGIRRVTPIPEGWRECSNDEFCQLLESAVAVPRRTKTGKSA
jgi:hypothetical protein